MGLTGLISPMTPFISVLRERQKRDGTRALDRLDEFALLLRSDAGQAARHDLAVFGDERLQQFHVFVINVIDFFGGEARNAAAARSSPRHARRFTAPLFGFHISHNFSSLVLVVKSLPSTLRLLRYRYRSPHRGCAAPARLCASTSTSGRASRPRRCAR